MAHPPSRRTRGLNFLLGGTLVAVAFLAFGLFSGQFDFGMGAPHVRIDNSVGLYN